MTKRIGVALLLSEGLSSRGGIGRVINYLVRSLTRIAPDILVVPLAARATDTSLWKHASVPISLATFIGTLISRQIGVVHINLAPRGSTWRKMIYARTAQAMKRKVILHLHGSAYDEYFASLGPSRRNMVRHFFQSADRVVTLSERWTQFVIDELGVPSRDIMEIANGVPAADPPVGIRAASVPGIAFLGVVGHRKGTDILLQALANLNQRGIAFQAVIGGNGEVNAARQQAERLGIAAQVTFLGWVEEDTVDRVLRDAHIFVLPSRAENQPVSILEAMARELPVVATHVGAIPHQVADGETGLLVAPGDVAGLADALARLLEDDALRLTMGRAGLARFQNEFSMEACAQKFADLYRELAR